MTGTGNSRDEQARDEEDRQRERPEARDRADEADHGPGQDNAADAGGEADDSSDSSRSCHRRNCTEPVAFVVLERYQEETGHGAVEAEAFLCREHTDEESPANLDGAYENYVFRVEPIGETATTDTA